MKRLLSIIGWAVFLGLAGLSIWRWEANGYGTFVWIASSIGMSLIRAPYAKHSAGKVIVDKTESAKEGVLLALVFVGATLLPLIHLATGALAFANYTLPIWALALGAGLILAGLWLFWRSHVDLGRNWSVTTELHDEQTLVTEGVYRKIRHPMYSAIWLLFLAQPLLVHNWIAGLSGPIAFGLMYFIRVPYEEAMMREKFGAHYEAYMKRSGRLFPG